MKAELLLAEIRPTEYLSCFDIFFHVSDFFFLLLLCNCYTRDAIHLVCFDFIFVSVTSV